MQVAAVSFRGLAIGNLALSAGNLAVRRPGNLALDPPA
jgi:hypothetical protein